MFCDFKKKWCWWIHIDFFFSSYDWTHSMYSLYYALSAISPPTGRGSAPCPNLNRYFNLEIWHKINITPFRQDCRLYTYWCYDRIGTTKYTKRIFLFKYSFGSSSYTYVTYIYLHNTQLTIYTNIRNITRYK